MPTCPNASDDGGLWSTDHGSGHDPWIRGSLRRDTRQIQAAEPLARHVKLDEGGSDGGPVEPHVAGGRHGNQALDTRQGHRAAVRFQLLVDVVYHRLTLTYVQRLVNLKKHQVFEIRVV